jgi:hypothetical protein
MTSVAGHPWRPKWAVAIAVLGTVATLPAILVGLWLGQFGLRSMLVGPLVPAITAAVLLIWFAVSGGRGRLIAGLVLFAVALLLSAYLVF